MRKIAKLFASIVPTIILFVGIYLLLKTLFDTQDLALLGIFDKPADLLIIIFASVLLAVTSSASWKILLSSVHPTKPKFSHAIIHTGMTLIGKYIPGKIWGIALKTMFSRRLGLEPKSVLVASILEFPFSIFFSIWFAAVLFLLGFSIWTSLLYVLASIAIYKLINKHLNVQTLRKHTEFSKIAKNTINKYLTEIKDHKLSTKTFIIYGLLNIAQWLQIGVILVITCLMFNPNLNLSDCLSILSIYIFSVIFGFFVVFAPGGIIAREAAFIILTAGILDNSDSTKISALLRVWNISYDLAFSTLSGFLLIHERKSTT